jgi:exocyst complex component 4
MSAGSNPYADNAYLPTGASNINAGSRYGNPYSQQSATPSNPYAQPSTHRSNPYAQQDTAPSNPYAQPTNPSSSSVNSYASRERRERNHAGSSEAVQDPYNQPTRAGGGYGGLGAPVRPETRERQNSGASGMQSTRGAVGYGGLQAPSRPETRERQNSDTASARSRERDQYQPRERGPYQAPSRPVNGYRDSPSRRPVKTMEEVLQHIKNDWKVMGGDECVPVQMALKLMDQSSLGLADRETEFQETHVDLQRSLKSIVNEHHQDFNSSIGTYHKIQSSIHASQSRVRYLKGSLANAKGGLLTTKPELKGLATSSQELDDTLQLLGQIENVQQVPERLEARISEKRFLTAVDVLQGALRLVRKSELDDITGVADLRTYFTTQEQSMTDILIEELHDHLYLKSPYCQDRWKVKSSQDGEKDAEASMMRSNINSWDKPLYHFLNDLDTKKPMTEDASRNPEADTFYYIHMILESLTRLGHLDVAISRIEQRLPVEMYKVVEKTTNDIDIRYPNHARSQPETTKRRATFSVNVDGRGPVLSEFLYTLYSKFEAIAEGHRVVHDVVTGIAAREQMSKPEQYSGGFTELWNLLQSEMRSLLHDYLATGSEVASRAALSSNSGNDVFNSRRDKNKKLFRLGEMDQKSAGMKTEEQELDDILKSSVPGLVSKTRSNAAMVNGSGRTGQDSTAAGHKLLAEASVFNMTILLPPSLSFLQHLKDIIPASSKIVMSTLTSFLDEFLINVFLPQLEESVTELCTQCMIDLDAFQEDPMSLKYSPKPVFKGTVAFMSLMRAFSSMLTTLPHDDKFTELILSQLITYCDKCYSWYKSNVSRLVPSSPNSSISTPTVKAAAGYAVSGEIHDVVVELQQTQSDAAKRSPLIEKEVQLLLSATKSHPLSPFDIISDPKSVSALCLLHNSMQWLAASLAQLRSIEANIKPKGHSRNTSLSRPTGRWTLLTLKPHMQPTADGGPPVYLPLTTETATKFDANLATFRTLAQTALFTLHIDVRCGIILRLNQSLCGPNADGTEGQVPPTPLPPRDSSIPDPDLSTWPWVLPSPPPSASPLVLSLNNDLIAFDENTSTYLGVRERSFISTGLARLVDRVLVTGASMIQVMNEHGAARMGLDVLVLQQNLRNITGTAIKPAEPTTNGLRIQEFADDEILRDSTQYYTSLFPAGPEKIMDFVQSRKAQKQEVGYSYDELRTLIELCYSIGLRAGREEGVKAKKDSQSVLLRLGEAIWDQ